MTRCDASEDRWANYREARRKAADRWWRNNPGAVEAAIWHPGLGAALVGAMGSPPEDALQAWEDKQWATPSETHMVWTEHEVDITRPRSKAYRRARWNEALVELGVNAIPDRDGVYRRAVAYWHQIARTK